MTLHEICTKYYNDIYHHCLKRLNFNADAAAEITQQVFSVLCERWEEVQNHPNITGWLIKTANIAIQQNNAPLDICDKITAEVIKQC